MAWWDTLLKVGGAAAAPFTAGMSLAPALAIGGGTAAAGFLAGRNKTGNNAQSPSQAGTPFDGAAGDATTQLVDSSARLRDQAGSTQQLSADALAPVLNYFKSLMGSDPSALMAATRQERGRVIDQYDTARRAIASFGPRGGGTTSALAASRFDQAESLADITSGVQRDAAGQAGQLGVQLASLGLSAEQLASSDLSTVIQAALAKSGLDLTKRGQNLQVVGDVGEAIGQILGMFLTRPKEKAT